MPVKELTHQQITEWVALVEQLASAAQTLLDLHELLQLQAELDSGPLAGPPDLAAVPGLLASVAQAQQAVRDLYAGPPVPEQVSLLARRLWPRAEDLQAAGVAVVTLPAGQATTVVG